MVLAMWDGLRLDRSVGNAASTRYRDTACSMYQFLPNRCIQRPWPKVYTSLHVKPIHSLISPSMPKKSHHSTLLSFLPPFLLLLPRRTHDRLIRLTRQPLRGTCCIPQRLRYRRYQTTHQPNRTLRKERAGAVP